MKIAEKPQYDAAGVLIPESHKHHRHDRKDGWYIEDMDSFHKYFIHMSPNRADNEVCLLDELDITRVIDYLAAKNATHPEYKITIFHVIITALAKVIYQRPDLNRFISGRRFYQRKKMVLSFVAKKKFADEAEEAMMMLRPKVDDNLESLTKKIVGDISQARKNASDGADYGADKALDMVGRLPRWLMMLVMFIFRRLDFHGLFPESFTSVDPNFSTVLLSNLGSIKCSAPYHHISNFGSCSVMLAIGTMHKDTCVKEDDEIGIRSVLDFGITLDERISDGFYFSKCIKLMQYILDNPALLDEPIGKPVAEEFVLHK